MPKHFVDRIHRWQPRARMLAYAPFLTPEQRLAFKEHLLSYPGVACTLWQGMRSGGGYGLFELEKVFTYAHKIAWQEHYETEVPEGYHIGHSCKNPPCVTPAHLTLLSPEQYDAIRNQQKAVKQARFIR